MTLSRQAFKFNIDFGLKTLPIDPGLLLIRGARQYGKSTWLEQQIAKTIKEFGPGSALYLNGDILFDPKDLITQIRLLKSSFKPNSKVKRLFIDEITAVPNWERSLKYLIDSGELENILIITTGSKAQDLRRGSERLPGRKGKLERTNYIFTPISYGEFKKQCGEKLGKDTVRAYMLSGGSPIACNELAQNGRLPQYLLDLVSDWILGEFTKNNRTRSSLLAVIKAIFDSGTNPVGQSKIARESGLANNTVAQGYIALLQDLLILTPTYPLNPNNGNAIRRKPCKYHFVNTLAAITWHPANIREISELDKNPHLEGLLLEWTVAQELFRRACLEGTYAMPDELLYWASKTREVDFVSDFPNNWIEVKRGAENPLHYAWFTQTHPKGNLKIINKNRFESERIQGITIEDFLSAPNH